MDNEKRAGGLRGAWKRQSAAQQQAAEKRRLGPALQALKALHSVGRPGFHERRGTGTSAQDAGHRRSSGRPYGGPFLGVLLSGRHECRLDAP